MMDYEDPNLELPDDLSEMIEEPEEDSSEALSSITGESEDQPAEQEEQGEQTKAKSEPGYVQGRIAKAVSKVESKYEQQIADMKAEYDAKLAPLRERILEMDAQELVKSGQIKDINVAKELVRLRNGLPPVSEPEAPAQPRQANGQFAPKTDPATQARISMLDHQAKRILQKTGLDVTAEFVNNPEVKAKVISGEMDFEDVAELMQQPKKRPPSPVRSPNGATGMNPNAIANMTDAQFRRMVENVRNGARYKLE